MISINQNGGQTNCLQPHFSSSFFQSVQVIEEKNIGKWLSDQYGDRDRFKKVIERVVYDRGDAFGDRLHQCVTLIPNATVNEMYVKLCQLDYSEDAKSGCCLVKVSIGFYCWHLFSIDSKSNHCCILFPLNLKVESTQSIRTWPTSNSTSKTFCGRAWTLSGNPSKFGSLGSRAAQWQISA